MSYQALARKWRPADFTELMGQEHVKQALCNALTSQRLHHAYLFTGTRGVGKTTIARILAKSLNCDLGISSTPCGKCDICQDVEQGRFVDLIEIDAASRTKVEDTREILDNVQYAPTRGRYKVYLIDEVHMLSKHSFNALLKTLEEPPEHVKFLLATTDPQKLPVTILSRCLQFNLKSLSRSQIVQQLQSILVNESIPFEENALKLIAKAAKGSMRDALSLTDQAIAQTNENIDVGQVNLMLGTIDQSWSMKVLECIFTNDNAELIKLKIELAMLAPNYSALLDDILNCLHLVALTQFVNDSAQLDEENAEFIRQAAEKVEPESIQLYYQIVLNGKRDLPFSSDEKTGFEMMLIRLMSFQPLSVANTNEESNDSPVARSQSDFKRGLIQEAEPATSTAIPVSNRLHDESPISEKPVSNSITEKDSEFASQEFTESESVELTHDKTHSEPNQSAQLFEQQNEILDVAAQQGFNPVVENSVQTSLQNSVQLDDQPESLPEVSKNQDSSITPDNSLPMATDDILPNAVIAPNDSSAQHNDKSDQIVNDSVKDAVDYTTIDDPLNAILMSREVQPTLHSQQGNAESESKKSEAAISLPNEQTDECNDIQINAAKPLIFEEINDDVRLSAQLDQWACVIDTMNLSGRLRQIAIHSMCNLDNILSYIDPNTHVSENLDLVLTLFQEQAHLLNDTTFEQLTQALTNTFNRTVTIKINYTDEVLRTPFNIQLEVDQYRLKRSKEIIFADPNVQFFQQEFDATVNEDSITPCN